MRAVLGHLIVFEKFGVNLVRNVLNFPCAKLNDSIKLGLLRGISLGRG